MKTFKVFHHHELGLKAVKEGFSWPGLFFGCWWMLWHGMLAWALLFFVINVAINFVNHLVGPDGSALARASVVMMYLYMYLYPGYKGNQIREVSLTGRGFRLVDTLMAENGKEAIASVQSRLGEILKAQPAPQSESGLQNIHLPTS